jgi:hypothetical protein
VDVNFVGLLLAAIFFFGAGLVFLLWPEEMRDWTLKSYTQAGFTKPVVMQKLMFTPGYILAFRVGGGISIVVSGLLACVLLKHSL